MSSLAKSGLVLAGLAVASKSLGLWRDAVVADIFGLSGDLDAYVIASALPLLLLNILFGGALVGAFIPAFTRRLEREGENEAWRYTASIALLLMLVSAVLVVVLYIGAPIAVDLIGPGLAPDLRTRAVVLSRWVIFALPFFVAATIAGAILNAHEEFKEAGARHAANNIAFIVAVITLASTGGVFALAAAFILGGASQLLVQVPKLVHLCRGKPLRVELRGSDVRELLTTYGPILAVHTMIQGTVVLDRAFSTLAGTSGAAAYQFAERFVDISRSVIGSSVAVVIFPQLSRSAASGDNSSRLVARAMGVVTLTTVPLAFALGIFGDSFIALILEHGSFGAAERILVSSALVGLAPATVFYGILYVFDRQLISTGRLGPYAVMMVLALAVNLSIKLWLTESMGLTGVALGTTAGVATFVVLATVFMAMTNMLAEMGTWARDLISSVGAFGVGFAVAVAASRAIELPENVAIYAGLGWAVLAGLIGWAILHTVKSPAYVALQNAFRQRRSR